MKKGNSLLMGVIIAYVAVTLLLFFCYLSSHGKTVYESGEAISVPVGEEGTLAADLGLNPGIYEVILSYDIDTEVMIDRSIRVEDETLDQQRLLCSGGPVYNGRSQMDFSFILRDTSSALKLVLGSGSGAMDVAHIWIRDTGKRWTVFWGEVTVLFLAAMAGIGITGKIRRKEWGRDQILTGGILAVIWLIASLPFFYDASMSTADSLYHMHRIEGVMHSLRAGIIPVRLEPHWLQGYGYANGVFYCDLFFVPAAIIRLLGFSVTAAFNFYGMYVNAATVAVSYYVFREIFRKTDIALLTCGIYCLSCMHIYKLVQTGAVGEGTALVFLPLILLGLYRIFCGSEAVRPGRTAFLPIALGGAGLVCCHVLSTEITVGVVLLFLLLYVRKWRSPVIWGDYLKGGLGALLLSAWFVIPFLDYYIREDIHVKHVFARTIQSEGLFFPQLYMLYWPNGGEKPDFGGLLHAYPSGVGLAAFAAVLGYYILWGTGFFGTKGEKTLELYGFGKRCAVLSTMLMVVSLRSFPWDLIQEHSGMFKGLISGIQFPNRFLQWALLFGTVCIGCILLRLSEDSAERYLMKTCLIAFLVVSVFYQTDRLTEDGGWFYLGNPEGMGVGYISGGEYLIQDTDPSLLKYEKITCGSGVSYSGPVFGALRCDAYVQNGSAEDSYIEFPLLYYGGYRAFDETGKALPVVSGDNHVVRVILPAGYTGGVTAGFVSPGYWRIAELISIFSTVGIVILWLRRRKYGRIPEDAVRSDGTETVQPSFFTEKTGKPAIKVFLFAATLLLVAAPYLTGYVFFGSYLMENLEKMGRMAQSLSVSELFSAGGLFMLPGVLAKKIGAEDPQAYIFLILFWVVVFYFLLVKTLRMAYRGKETSVIPEFSAMLYLLSPLSLYLLYTKTALGDVAAYVLLVPAFAAVLKILERTGEPLSHKLRYVPILVCSAFGILIGLKGALNRGKEMEIIAAPLKALKMFQLFPYKGAYNYKMYLSKPLQISPVFLLVILAAVFLALVCKNGFRMGMRTKILSVISGGLVLLGCLPLPWHAQPLGFYKLGGTSGILALANGLVPFILLSFDENLQKAEVSRRTKLAVTTTILMLAVGLAIFQMNDILLESEALWLEK